MSQEKIHLDFESRSTAPFGKGGVTTYQYARDPTTEILLASYKIGSDPVERWRRGERFPKRLREAVGDKVIVCAHNFAFEWEMWNTIWVPTIGAPPLPFSQGDCTAIRAAICALPRSLEGACDALNLDIRKDMEGSKVMLKMAKPRKARKDEDPDSIWWWDTPELIERLHDYCDTDVEAEYRLDLALPEMSADERELWLMDHRTNQRGVLLNIPFVKKVQRIRKVASRRYAQELTELTDGEVTSPTQPAQMRSWINDNSTLSLSGFDKTLVENALKEEDLRPDVRRVLEIRQEAGKSSVAKYDKYLLLSYIDHVMRENFLHHGANTGRGAGRGAQLQNLPSRGGLKWYQALEIITLVMKSEDPEWMFDVIELLYGSVPESLSSCLRLCIIARAGKKLFVADFSNIEGRIAAWLGNEKSKLEAFRLFDTPVLDDNGEKIPDKDTDFLRAGPDLYKVTASMITGRPVSAIDKVLRNILGKVPELSLGFGGGSGALTGMADTFNIQIADFWDNIRQAVDARFVEKAFDNWASFGKRSGTPQDAWVAGEVIKLAWRAKHPGIVRCWKECEDTAVEVIQDAVKRYADWREARKTDPKAELKRGRWKRILGGHCAMGAREIAGKMFLMSRLPNGRIVYKADVSLKLVKKFGRMVNEIRFWTVDPTTRKWVRTSTYGGDLFQTFVQAIARDIMKDGMLNVEAAGFDPILEVHDEVGAEGDPSRDIHEYESLMATLRECYDGCPVSALGYVSDEYRKD